MRQPWLDPVLMMGRRTDLYELDGRGTLTGCIIWAPKNKIYHIVLAQVVPAQKAA